MSSRRYSYYHACIKKKRKFRKPEMMSVLMRMGKNTSNYAVHKYCLEKDPTWEIETCEKISKEIYDMLTEME